MTLRLVLLGSPGTPGDPVERWHDDVYAEALALGWSVDFLRARDMLAEDIVRLSVGADLLLWMRTHDYNIRGGDGRAMLRAVEDAGCATVGMHFDLYWGIRRRQDKIGVEPWWSAQHVFTADGGPRRWISRGVNHHWLPPAFGSRFLGYGQSRTTRYRAVFVGSNIPTIHTAHRSNMLRWAQRNYGRSFLHVGRTASQRVYGHDLNNLYAASALVLGDSAPSPYYWSDRLPRTLGRGGLLAYPNTPGLDEWGFTSEVMLRFRPGQFGEIPRLRRSLAVHERRAMTDNAITLVRERHLWRHRLEHIAEVVLNGARDYRGGGAAREVGELPGGAVALGPRAWPPAVDEDGPAGADHLR